MTRARIRFLSNAPLVALLLMLFATGCRQDLTVSSSENVDSAELVIKPTQLKLPARLASELENVEGQPRVGCPFQFTNDTGETRLVELGGTGCACYGLFYEGRKLARGERIEISPGQAVEFAIYADPATTEHSRDYQAWFLQQHGGKWHRTALECGVRVVSDVSITPAIQTFLLKPGAESERRTVTVTRSCRKPEALETGPELQNIPAEITIDSVTEKGDAHEFEPGLWQRQWEVTLHAKLLESTDVDASPATLDVLFAGSDHADSAGGEFQTAVRLDLPIRYPRTVQFGNLDVGQPRTRKLLISSADREFELSPVETSEEDLSVRVAEPQAARKHWVEITLQPTALGAWRREVVLHTNLPEVPLLKISVSAMVVAPL